MEGDECIDVFSNYNKLPGTFQIPQGYAVCSSQKGSIEIFEDSQSFFKSYATDWSKLLPYEHSKPGSKMSEFINSIVGKGISESSILSRCINVIIRDIYYFGILNSLNSPFGAEVVMPVSMNSKISFVHLLNHGHIQRNYDEKVNLFVRILQEKVIM